jgi:hypothetical protein
LIARAAIVASLGQSACASSDEPSLAGERGGEPDAAGHLTPDGALLADAPSGSDAGASDGTPCGTATFDLTETQELWTVPANVGFMHVKAWGAGGNGEGQCADDGGIGGYSEAVFEVFPGDSLVVIVGQRGRAGMTGEELFKFGFGQWGGGGLSGVFSGSTEITEASSDRALIIAGGGGGASAPGCHPGGTGNHPNAGGQTTMQGGAGADDVNSGGGGYLGGPGGAHLEGGKGGSGFVAASALDSRILFVEPQSGKPPETDDPDYDGIAGTIEANGLVVIHFSCEGPVIP